MVAVKLSRKAEIDYDGIVDYSVATFGADIADDYVADLNAALTRLAEFPQLGFVVPELRHRPRCLPCRQHRIYYRIEKENVLVARILHHAMDARRWLD